MSMMKAALLLFAISSATLAQAPPAARTGLPAGSGSTLYTGNRAPLRPSPLVKLPAGAVRPEGWLRGQLVRQAEGFSGRLSGISQFCRYAGNAWTTPGGAGRFGWEEVPYWLKGYVDLGYVLGDERILAESKRWIEAVLATTRPDGWFGPRSNFDVDMYLSDTRALDLWPNMVMLYPLRTYYEATGDRAKARAAMWKRWKPSCARKSWLAYPTSGALPPRATCSAASGAGVILPCTCSQPTRPG